MVYVCMYTTYIGIPNNRKNTKLEHIKVFLKENAVHQNVYFLSKICLC